MRDINSIIIHNSATPPERDIGVTEIREWHVNGNKWSDIGYHYVIRLDGTLEVGRTTQIQGAHAKGFNENSVGICMVGGVDDELKPANTFSIAQFDTLAILIRAIRKEFPIESVLGHGDLFGASTECPSFDVAQFLIDHDINQPQKEIPSPTKNRFYSANKMHFVDVDQVIGGGLVPTNQDKAYRLTSIKFNLANATTIVFDYAKDEEACIDWIRFNKMSTPDFGLDGVKAEIINRK